MKNNKLVMLVIALLLGALVLSACGGQVQEAAPTVAAAVEEAAAEVEQAAEEVVAEPTEAPMEEPTEAPMEEPTEEPMPEPTEEVVEEAPAEAAATLVIWADDKRAPVLESLKDEFLASAGVELIVEQVASADIREQATIAIPAGEGPDIFIIAHDQIGGFVDGGLIAPVDLGDKRNKILDNAITAFTYNSEVYALPYAQDVVALFRNVDLVPEPVETWDELMEVGAALMADGSADNATIFPNTNYHIYGLNTAFGGYIFGTDDDGNYLAEDVGLDSEGFIASGDFIQQVVEDGLVPATADEQAGNALFEQGRLPFILNGPWKLPDFRAAGVNFAVDPIPAGPAGPGAPFLGAQGFVVNALSENQLLAQTFLTELVATDEIMAALQEQDPRIPAWIPTYEAVDDADLAGFGVITPYAQPMPNIPQMAAVWGSWGDAIQLIMNGEEAPVDALTNAATQIREAIAE